MLQLSKNTRALLLAAAIAVVPAVAVFIYFRPVPLLGDSGAFAGIACHIVKGKALYSQVWDNKAPGVFLFFALLLKTVGFSCIFHVIQALLALVFSWVLLWFVYIKLGIEYWFVALFLPLFFAVFQLWGFYFCGHYTEEYGAYLLFFSATSLWLSKGKRALILSGFLASLSVLFKEPFVFVAMVVFVNVLHTCSRKQWLYWLAGAALPVLFFVLYLWFTGGFLRYSQYLAFASGYAAAAGSKWANLNLAFGQLVTELKTSCGFTSLIFWVVHLVALGGFVAPKLRLQLVFTALMAITSLVFVMLGSQFYGHYFLPFIFFYSLFIILAWLNFIYGIFVWFGPTLFSKILIFLLVIPLYKPAIAGISHFLHQRYPIVSTEQQEREITCSKLKKYKTIYADYQSFGRVYFYTKKWSNNEFPCPYYTLFEQQNNSKIALINATLQWQSFAANPPQALVSGSNLNIGFAVSNHMQQVLNNYPIVDSMFTAEGEKLYIRELKPNVVFSP